MADPFTLSMIATNCVWGLVTGPFGNRADAALTAAARRLAKTLSESQTPENHDILKATHEAWVLSVQAIVALSGSATTDYDERQAQEKLARLVGKPEFTELRFVGAAIPLDSLEAIIAEIYRADTDPDGAATDATIARIEQLLGFTLPPVIRAVFLSGHAGKRGWAQTFQLFFSEAVKTNERVFRELAFERLNEIVAFAARNEATVWELHETVEAFRREMHDRFDVVDRKQDEHTALLQQILANQGGGPQAQIELLRALASAYAEQFDADDLDGLRTYLLAKVGQWREFSAQIEALEVEGNRDAVLLAEAREATDRGDFDTADALLAEAVEAFDDKIAPLLIAKADRLALRAENGRIAGRYADAVSLYDQAASTVPMAAEAAQRHAWSAASTQQEWGERFPDSGLLSDAIGRWRQLGQTLSRDDDPERWAATQNNLGNALRALGAREEGTASLDAAVAAYRDALEVRTRDRLPLQWAMTQNNLGNALRALGAREEGTASLEAAVTAYRDALEVRTRDRLPLDWAMTQNNLGNALQTLGAREEGTVSLEAAVTAYRDALEVRTRDRLPLDWAATSLNLILTRALIHERGGAQVALASLREDAIQALTVLIDGGHAQWAGWGRHVVAQIDRIAGAA